MVCSEYKIESIVDSKFSWTRDWPIDKCDGYFSLSPAGVNAAKGCAKDAAGKCSSNNVATNQLEIFSNERDFVRDIQEDQSLRLR